MDTTELEFYNEAKKQAEEFAIEFIEIEHYPERTMINNQSVRNIWAYPYVRGLIAGMFLERGRNADL